MRKNKKSEINIPLAVEYIDIPQDILDAIGDKISNGALESTSDFNYEDYEEEEEEDYSTQYYTEEISFIEFAIINAYLHDSYRGKQKDVITNI